MHEVFLVHKSQIDMFYIEQENNLKIKLILFESFFLRFSLRSLNELTFNDEHSSILGTRSNNFET